MQSSHLREHNLSMVLSALAAAKAPISRAGLAEATGLTKPTVSKLVEELLRARMVEEGEPVSAGLGRPKVPLRPASGTLLAIGLEIAADHISALGIDLAGATTAHQVEYLPVPARSLDEVVELSAALVGRLRTAAGPVPVAGAVVAIPGRISPHDGSVLSAPNLGWTDMPIVDRLSSHPDLSGVPLRAQNDNRLSVITEIDARPGQSFIYLRGSTGVGGAVVLGGELFDGQHGWAGEFGHMVIDTDGPQCQCGRRGCLEAYISYYSLIRRAALGADVRIEDLIDELSRSTDRSQVIGTIGRTLGIAIANALNVLDMSTVVLSGYLAPIADEITPIIRETVQARALAAEAGPITIDRSDGTPAPALLGAARAALQPVLNDPGPWIDARA